MISTSSADVDEDEWTPMKGDGGPVNHGEEEEVPPECSSVAKETVTKTEQDPQEHEQMMTMRFIKQFYPHVIPIEDEEELESQEELIKTIERRDKQSSPTARSETSALSNDETEKDTDSETDTLSDFDRSSRLSASGPDRTFFPCQICRKIFVKEDKLSIHMASHKPQICGVCKKHFPDNNLFTTHKCKPAKRLPACSHCGKIFASWSAVNIHTRIHTGEKPHTCILCGRAFSQKGNLQSHLRIHTGERPFKCHQCERTFVQKVQLTQHLTSHINQTRSAQSRSQP